MSVHINHHVRRGAKRVSNTKSRPTASSIIVSHPKNTRVCGHVGKRNRRPPGPRGVVDRGARRGYPRIVAARDDGIDAQRVVNDETINRARIRDENASDTRTLDRTRRIRSSPPRHRGRRTPRNWRRFRAPLRAGGRFLPIPVECDEHEWLDFTTVDAHWRVRLVFARAVAGQARA
jgi:hypothetical protein